MRILVDFCCCCLFICFLERENGAIKKAHKLREGEGEGGRRSTERAVCGKPAEQSSFLFGALLLPLLRHTHNTKLQHL